MKPRAESTLSEVMSSLVQFLPLPPLVKRVINPIALCMIP